MGVNVKITKKGNLTTIEFFNNRVRNARLIFILVFSILGFLAPIAAVLVRPDKVKSAVLISFAIFWGASFYLLRLFLWNSYGREVIVLTKGQVEYFCDYKLFKLNKKKIVSDDIEIVFLNEEKSSVSLDSPELPPDVFILIKSGKETITTHFAIPSFQVKSNASIFNNLT